MKRMLIVLAFSLGTINVYSQKISGQVHDEAGKPLTGATVALYKKGDSTVYKTTLTASEGTFTFYKVTAGTYSIRITNIGFFKYNSNGISYDGRDVQKLDVMTLRKDVSALKNVTVTTTTPPIEVKADKIIFNVENNITAAGLDGMELLKRSPGVMVDEEDNISIAGKSGLQVYIDGRPSPLHTKDLSNYLRSLRSTAIEAIEIISNPSAKYEAAGTGGIINIRLRKNKIAGTNGSVNAEYQQGVFPKYNTGFALNHRNTRVNLFSNYTYNRGVNLFARHIIRTLSDSIFDATTELITHVHGHVYKASVDYFLNKRSILGFMADGAISGNEQFQNRRNFIRYAPTHITDRILLVPNESNGKQNSFNYNVNYHYADTSGRDLNIDANYGLYESDNTQYQPNIFYDTTLQYVLSTKTYTMMAPSNIDIYTLKADYEEVYKKARLGLGVKLAYINSDNVFKLYNHDADKLMYDSTYSNHFVYKENINAAYVTYMRTYKIMQVQVGLRIENTSTTGQSIGFTKNAAGVHNVYDTLFERQYTSFFPSASITFNKNPKNQFTFSYSRRIKRPSYQDLNPFDTKADEYGGFKGNPELRPAYAHSASITNVYHTNLVTNIGYTVTNDQIVSLSIPYEKVKSNFNPANVGKSENLGFTINYSYRKKWYSLIADAVSFYVHNSAAYGGVEIIDSKAFATNISAANSFKLGGGITGLYH
jgi:iron complex outermembrane receptor protein